MKKFFLMGAALLLTGASIAAAQEQQQTQETQQQQQPQKQEPAQPGQQQEPTQPAPPPLPPRVVGQARTQEELQAWQVIDQTAEMPEKAALAEKFLVDYPKSGLTPYAHKVLARHSYQSNSVEEFLSHADTALQELPNDVDLLGLMAFVYAEKGQAQRAIDNAQKTLDLIETLDKPANLSAVDWISRGRQLRADANYALGRAYLHRFSKVTTEEPAQNPNLNQAITFLEKAVAIDPRHDYAYFRLGFAHASANNAEMAIKHYARAAAIGGVAADPARNQLEHVHQFVKENLPDTELAQKEVQQLVDEQRQKIQEEVAENEAEVQKMAQELEAQLQQQQPPELPPAQPGQPAPSQPTPPPPPPSQ